MYEPPLSPDLVLKAGEVSVQECVEQVVSLLAGQVCYMHTQHNVCVCVSCSNVMVLRK